MLSLFAIAANIAFARSVGKVLAICCLVTWLAAPPVPVVAQTRLSDFPTTPTVQMEDARNIRLDPSSGCGVPRGTVSRRSGVHIVTLENGDIGRCPTDGEARHNAPHWERAMLYSSVLPKRGQTYRVSAEFLFDPGYSSSDRTTFFQIHQSNGSACDCWPFFQIRIDRGGGVFITAPERRSVYTNFRVPGWTRRDFSRQWVEVAVEVNTSPGDHWMTVYVGGQQVYRGLTTIREAGQFQRNRPVCPLCRSLRESDNVHFR